LAEQSLLQLLDHTYQVLFVQLSTLVNSSKGKVMRRIGQLAAAVLLIFSLSGCMCAPWFCGPGGGGGGGGGWGGGGGHGGR
jgi:hypothetical protein